VFEPLYTYVPVLSVLSHTFNSMNPGLEQKLPGEISGSHGG
jgi:hypothetical protein